MSTGEGGIPPLTVDPELLERYGNQLLTAAGNLPEAPPPFTVTGTDPMSQAIADKLPTIEGDIQSQLPQLKDQATTTASTIVSAAGQYKSADQQNAADIEKHQFDSAGGATGAGAGGGAGGMSQMSQLMSMPMQMAGQAMQMPMQAMGALASVPQGIMQGVQQVSQMAGGLGGSEGAAGGKPGEPTEDRAEKGERRDDKAERDARDGATPGAPNAERAPDSASKDAPAPAPQQGSPRHAAPDPTVNL
jgi:ESX secretion-associated protein EspJ